MLRRIVFIGILISSLFLLKSGFACDMGTSSLSRHGEHDHEDHARKLWFFDFGFEQQNWDEMDVHEAHTLHHDGHHIHYKTHEEFYRFSLGVNPWDTVTIFAELPYVVRESIEVHSHRRLGEKQTSEGMGDLHLTGVWRFYEAPQGYLGVLGGVKFATGSTTEKNTVGGRYEAELQPGTGSTDGNVGGIFQHALSSTVSMHGNAIYVFRSEGDQNFEYGDLFSGNLSAHYLVNPESPNFQTEVGLETSLQVEKKQIEEGEEVADSGGTTLFLGPTLSVNANGSLSLFGKFLFPVYQDLGGVHQELDFVWNAGAKIVW